MNIYIVKYTIEVGCGCPVETGIGAAYFDHCSKNFTHCDVFLHTVRPVHTEQLNAR